MCKCRKKATATAMRGAAWHVKEIEEFIRSRSGSGSGEDVQQDFEINVKLQLSTCIQ